MKTIPSVLLGLKRLILAGCVCFLLLSAVPATGAAALPDGAAVGWTGPVAATSCSSLTSQYMTASADGSRIVFLDIYNAADPALPNDSHPIWFVEFKNTAWTAPLTVATNGHHSSDSVVTMPATVPQISGNGNTIAYVGYVSQGINGLFVIERNPDGSWNAPARVDTTIMYNTTDTFGNSIDVDLGTYLGEEVGISDDGSRIAFRTVNACWTCSYPQSVYVMQKNNGIWSAPINISNEDVYPYYDNVHKFALNADGTKAVWRENHGVDQLFFSEFVNSAWTTPVLLAQAPASEAIGEDYYGYDLKYQTINAFGNRAVYWIARVKNSTVDTMDMYIVRRDSQGTWSAAEKVTRTPVDYLFTHDTPAAGNATYSRMVHHRYYKVGTGPDSVIYGSHLEKTDYVNGLWQTPLLLTNTSNGFDLAPQMSRDGRTVTYHGVDPTTHCNALLQMKTATATADTNVVDVVTSGTGSGVITASSGTGCGQNCFLFEAPAAVTLTAAPEPSSDFTGWSGCDSVNSNSCTIQASGSKSVTASFTRVTFTVSASKTGNGTVTPATVQTVPRASTAAYTVMPADGSILKSVTGCNGTLGGDGITYTTAAINADCTVKAEFGLKTFTVTPSSGANGAIEPAAAQTISYGGQKQFSLLPDPGYRVRDVTSDCGGSWSGSNYFIGFTSKDCSVSVSFEPEPPAPAISNIVPGNGEFVPAGGTWIARWSAPAAMTRFALYYSLNNGSSWTLIKSGINSNYYQWKVPVISSRNDAARIMVIGYSARGVATGRAVSSAPFIIAPIPPATPANLRASSSGTPQVLLTWIDKASNETAYVVQRATTINGPFTMIRTLPANSRSASDSLPRTGTYYYRVSAVNATGSSGYSELVRVQY